MNIPNALSLLRLLLVPVFAIVFFGDHPSSLYWAGGIYLFAGVTDIVDGYIARKYNQITKLGRILDPLADKLMQITAFVCLAVAGMIPVWVIVILAAKELTLVLGGAIVLKRVKDVPPSNVYGKAASTVFYFITIAVIVFPMSEILKIGLLTGALCLSVLALIMYSYKSKQFLQKKRKSL